MKTDSEPIKYKQEFTYQGELPNIVLMDRTNYVLVGRGITLVGILATTVCLMARPAANQTHCLKRHGASQFICDIFGNQIHFRIDFIFSINAVLPGLPHLEMMFFLLQA